MRAQNITPSGGLQEPVALLACDNVFLLQAAIAKAAALSPLGVVGGLESLGRSYPFASLPAGRFAPGKRFPVTRAWLWEWNAQCTCAKYTSPAFEMR